MRALIISLLVFAGSAISLTPLFAASLQITDLEDIDFGSVVPDARNVRQRIRFCVISIPAGPFQITAYGSTSSGDFVLSHQGLDHTIDYDVYVQRVFGLFRQQLHPGVPVTLRYARPPLRNGLCAPPYVNLLIDVDESTLNSAVGGGYFAILQLTVAPE